MKNVLEVQSLKLKKKSVHISTLTKVHLRTNALDYLSHFKLKASSPCGLSHFKAFTSYVVIWQQSTRFSGRLATRNELINIGSCLV